MAKRLKDWPQMRCERCGTLFDDTGTKCMCDACRAATMMRLKSGLYRPRANRIFWHRRYGKGHWLDSLSSINPTKPRER